MGVTIHFEGRLKSERHLLALVDHVERVASGRGWRAARIDREQWKNRDTY
ncbi:hypothetical protein [Maricaulis sp.]|nr:hypothetical protein [Maricaulis sp.]MBO6796308.1 hypothetical protein [Maricaulis sp.]